MPSSKAEDFLKTAHLYHLGELTTEARHPLTMQLSDWANYDLAHAYKALTQVDIEALKQFQSYIPQILGLREDIQKTFKAGGRIYLCGCGATGRLSLLIERLWRHLVPGDENVRALMAGGDTALVHSLESFEDYPEYGARHLEELGFTDNDLLISSTEGGETPYVIGATEYAGKHSQRKPYFLYCNPDDVLKRAAQRSKAVIQNKDIVKINLSVGPMALSGSTRMQASTVLQLALSYALLSTKSQVEIEQSLKNICEVLENNVEHLMAPLTVLESDIYKQAAFVMYEVKDYALSVFTDTTERAPTFSLTPFSHPKAGKILSLAPSLCYISLPHCETADAAWMELLGRKPHALEWMDVDARTSVEYLQNFDFGAKAFDFRKDLLKGSEQIPFRIQRGKDSIEFELSGEHRSLNLSRFSERFEEDTLLKLLLNQHSTLLMGRLGRYKNNVMTWVHPTNGKLIDRASRYAKMLLQDAACEHEYETIVKELFKQLETLDSKQSVVLKVVEALRYE